MHHHCRREALSMQGVYQEFPYEATPRKASQDPQRREAIQVSVSVTWEHLLSCPKILEIFSISPTFSFTVMFSFCGLGVKNVGGLLPRMPICWRTSEHTQERSHSSVMSVIKHSKRARPWKDINLSTRMACPSAVLSASKVLNYQAMDH